IDLFALQETNITPEKEEMATQNWQLPSFWNKHTAFLINNKNIQVVSLQNSNSRSITITLLLNNNKFTVNNVYFPPDRGNRQKYLNQWSTPTIGTSHFILLGDMNMSILTQNRISTTTHNPDSTINTFLSKIPTLLDSQLLAGKNTMATFTQHTKNNNFLMTKLDYIFLSPSLANYTITSTTKAGNSDHLLLETNIRAKTLHSPTFWKLNNSILNQEHVRQQAIDTLICSNN